MSTNTAPDEKVSVWVKIGLAVGVLVVAAAVTVLIWRGPEWIDGVNPAHLTSSDGPKATDVSGLRTAIAACVVGLVGLGTLCVTAVHNSTGRKRERAQFGLAQDQFNHAQGVQASNEARAQQQFELSQQQFELAQQQFQHSQDVQATNDAKAQQQFDLAQQQFDLARDTQSATREKDKEQAELVKEGQITDRYVKAVSLLDADGVTARMAGIYALERIMRDSEKDHETIVQLLAAFIRERSPVVDIPDDMPWKEAAVKNDVQAALTVLGHRPERQEDFLIDLQHVSLCQANLIQLRLEGVVFAFSNLSFAELTAARLARANFYRASLMSVTASGADLSRAHMQSARLDGGDFLGAKMADANLREARLSGADLRSVDMAGASLADAVLVDLEGQGHARVEVSQLLTATVVSGTLLPPDLRADPAMDEHIRDCDVLLGGI